MKLILDRKEANKTVKDVFDNFPEASLSLSCIKWKYKEFIFEFVDEDGKHYIVTKRKALKGLKKFVTAQVNGELLGLPSVNPEDWDASYYDAILQMSIFGEVIYG